MSIGKARDFLATFVLFIALVLIAGALFPQYFGVISQILVDNLGTFLLLVILAIIIYIIADRIREI
jgi:hypothetical protein